jgi:diaminohydroxyphosphoribosylaminopyrimidine deaminase/5-amino-6-(5-phosphoribosylamino)uracil reductase
VVLDEMVRLSPSLQLAQTSAEAPVILFGDSGSPRAIELRALGVEFADSNRGDLRAVLKELGSRSIQSVLIEGGSTVAGEFVDAGLVNKVTFFIAPKIVGGTDAPSAVGGRGVEAMSDALKLENVTVTQRGKDIEVTGYPRTDKGPADEG